MSRITRNRFARVRASLGAAPLQAERKEQQKKESAELTVGGVISILEGQILDFECAIKRNKEFIETLKSLS